MTRTARFAALAVAGAAWSAGFLYDDHLALLVMTPIFALGLFAMVWCPEVGALAVCAGMLLYLPADVAPDNPAGLLPAFVAMYVVARNRPWPAVLVVAVAGVAALCAIDEVSPANLVFGVLVFGGLGTFGQVVRRRALAAREAGRRRALVERTDPAGVATRVVAAERQRIAADAVGVIREAVTRMRTAAAEAAADLDGSALAEVQRLGAGAVADLRRLLGLLREEPTATPATPDDSPTAPSIRRSDLVLAGLAAVLSVVDGQAPGAPQGVASTVLGIALALTLVLRHRDPALAALAGVAITAIHLASGVGMRHGFAEIATIALLSWTVGVTSTRIAWTGLGAFALIEMAQIAGTEPENLPMSLAIFVVPAFAGHAWQDRDREYERAHAEASALQEAQDAYVGDAVLAERHRIARQLHDVASHAVGVMVLQAGAADAVRRTDPAAARTAVGHVEAAGDRALTELALLVDVLDLGLLSEPMLPDDLPDSLADSLAALADRLRQSGLDVGLELGALPTDPQVAAAVYLTAQEGLTNAARHAPGASVTVRVDRSPADLVVEVADRGGSRTHAPIAHGSGFGLVGLAERVRVLGGEVESGPAAGGFRLRVTLPVRDREAAR